MMQQSVQWVDARIPCHPRMHHRATDIDIGPLPHPLSMRLETILVVFNKATNIDIGPPLLRKSMKLCDWQNTGFQAML